jgi:hypothetical protein
MHIGLSSSGGGMRPPGRDKTQTAHRGERLRTQFGIEGDADALAALSEIERPFAAAIAVVFEDQSLNTELYALGVPGARRDMGTSAALVIDRHHRTVFDLDQIEPRDQAEAVG